MVEEWSNGALLNPDSEWQALQSCLNVPLWTSTWQAAQVSAFGFTFMAGCLWQAAHSVVAWRPSSGNDVCVWSMRRVRHVSFV